MKKPHGMTEAELKDYIFRARTRLVLSRTRLIKEFGKKSFDARLKSINALSTEVEGFFR
jgi:hypothetical protein